MAFFILGQAQELNLFFWLLSYFFFWFKLKLIKMNWLIICVECLAWRVFNFN